MLQNLKAMLKRRIRNAVGYAELIDYIRGVEVSLDNIYKILNVIDDRAEYHINSINNTQETIIQRLKEIESIHNVQTIRRRLSKSIFIVGHGRSGTTILLRALNTSQDIYLFGEANLYSNIWKDSFSSCYNLMHIKFKNKPERSTYAPKINIENSTGWHVLEYLSKYFKYIGEKVAFSDQSGNQKEFFDFSLSNFIDGHYLCVIRHPADVIASYIIEFYNANFKDKEKISNIIKSIYMTYDLIISIHKTFPNAYIVEHEKISKNTFDYLSNILNTNLTNAYIQYKPRKENKYEKYIKQVSAHKLYAELLSFHTDLVSCIDNDKYIFANHILLNELHRNRIIL